MNRSQQSFAMTIGAGLAMGISMNAAAQPVQVDVVGSVDFGGVPSG